MIEQALGTLVEFPTVTTDREANNEALDHIGDFLQDRGMHLKRYIRSGDVPYDETYRSIVATTRPDALDSTVMIASHLDVVPAESETAFTPDIVGDRFYGRGALDMKFNIAATMAIVDELYKSGQLSNYDLAVMITTDEEIGGMYGTQMLLDKYGYRPKVCILPDGGDNWQIQTGSKGLLHYAIKATGVSAHSRDPRDGENAITKASRAMVAIHGLFPEVIDDDTPTNSVNMARGGRATNQVPDECEFVFDARFATEAEKAEYRRAIGEVCLAHGVELTTLVDGKATQFDLANTYIAPFRRLVTEVTGIEVTGARAFGGSDARFFAEYDIPVVSLYPTGGGHHSEGEWISVKALHQYKDVLRMYLDQMARLPLLTPDAAAARSDAR
jgi:acetylornithine deacetylase/succinyl-diaminopimelate desuccinylase-like protein